MLKVLGVNIFWSDEWCVCARGGNQFHVIPVSCFNGILVQSPFMLRVANADAASLRDVSKSDQYARSTIAWISSYPEGVGIR